MKKYISLSVAVFVLTVIFVGVAFAEDVLKIRVGADSGSFSYQFRVAQSAGIFKKYNIDAEILTFSWGIDTLNAAIIGETDTAEAMDFATASRFSENSNLRIVALICVSTPGGSKLYTRNKNIISPADLENKRIGVMKATSDEYSWARLFEKYKLDADNVDQVYLSSNAELLAAYLSDRIDVFWATADTENAVLDIPESRLLGDNSLTGYLSSGYLLIDETFIKENTEGVIRFLKAIDEATVFIKENPDATAEITAKDLKIPFEAAKKNIAARQFTVRFLQQDIDQISSVASWSYANGLIRNNYDVKDVLYLDAIREAFPDRVDID
jgi:NitT/TauT family transport system substrate-binding protein